MQGEQRPRRRLEFPQDTRPCCDKWGRGVVVGGAKGERGEAFEEGARLAGED